jgi:hypothetical protein
MAASSAAQPATPVCAGAIALLNSTRCASSRSSAKCCLATAAVGRFSVRDGNSTVANRTARAWVCVRLEQFAGLVIEARQHGVSVAKLATDQVETCGKISISAVDMTTPPAKRRSRLVGIPLLGATPARPPVA